MTTIDQLFSEAEKHVADGLVPACQIAVGRDGGVVARAAFGDATDTTRFCIFSATKPMVASVVWLMLADGLVDPHDPIARHVPELDAAGFGEVTLEQVMLHTSGFPNAPMGHTEGSDPARRRARFATWSLEWEPGTRFEYHPASAHWVLADVIDRVTGQDYRDALEERICRPLGLPRALGLAADAQQDIAPLTPLDPEAPSDETMRFNEVDVRRAGNPGGGGFMTATDLACFYQSVLHNPGGLWDDDVLRDATTNIRCTLDDPMMGVPANRTLGLVLAGDDGHHQLRYAIFGHRCSPASFGHAGAHAQVAWADPATGISFSYLSNALDSDQMRGGIRANRLATIAADLTI